MRIFITSTDDDGTKRTTRIFLDNCTNTSALLKEVAKEMGFAKNSLIVKLKNEPYNLRIIENWPLSHYPLKNGSTLIVELNDNYVCRELSLSTEPLGRVQEEDDFDSGDEEQHKGSFISREGCLVETERQHMESKYLEQCLKRVLEAVKNGNLQKMAEILRQQPAIDDESDLKIAMQQRYLYLLNEVGDAGKNALHEAIQNNNPDIVSFLLIKGTNPTLLTTDSYTPLQLAVRKHSPEILTLLLQQTRIDVNQVTTHGSALHLAAALEDVKCIEILFQNDADTETLDESGRKAIEMTSNQNIRKLLQKKAEIRKGSVPFISKGILFRVTSLTYRLKERTLLINPFKNQFIIQNITKESEEKFQISLIDTVEEVEEKSWLMSSSMSYFKLTLKDKDKTELLFAVKNEAILEKWLGSFRAAVKFRENSTFTKPVPSSEQLIQLINDQTNQVTLHKRRIDTPSGKKTMSILNLLPDDDEPDHTNRIKSRLSMRKSDRRFINFSEEYVMDQSQIVVGSIVRGLDSNSSEKAGTEYASIVESTMEPSFLEKELSKNRFRKNSLNRSEYISEFKGEQAKIALSFRDFEIVKLLGSGAFGQVYEARYSKNNRIYALKVLNKQKLIKKKQLKYAVGEASILKKVDFPFVITLHFAFQTPQNLYLALDHCPHGDLAELITVRQRLSESTARFIISQIVLALEYLHSKNILYRDLKPENILIAGDGYVRLTDFGLSRENCFSMSFCGSPAYLSPEMLEKKGVGFSSDIYGIGCILFEMMVGEPPFFDENVDTLYDNIRNGKLRYPSHLSIEANSLISKLLERDINKRLGHKSFADIKNHDFFRKTNWKALVERKIQVPKEIYLEDPQSYYEFELDQAQPFRLSDTDYEVNTEKINRIKHFTFVRENTMKGEG